MTSGRRSAERGGDTCCVWGEKTIMCVCVVVVSALRHDHDDDGSNGEIVVREEVSIDHRSSSPSQLTNLRKSGAD